MLNASLSGQPSTLQNDDLFASLVRACKGRKAVPVAVCWPCNAVSLAGVVDATVSGLIQPVLVGPEHEMREIAAREGIDIGMYSIADVDTEEDAAVQSVELCRSRRAAALMKGSLHTDVLMHPVLKEQGLRTARRMSHVFILEAPLYPRRTLFISDAAINIYPSLEDKVGIVQNAIDLAHALGTAEPNVAILSAIETVNPKIISTVDAAALCKMADRGQITGGILDGPLGFDTAVSSEAALAKKVRSPVAGEADILIAPDLEAANMLAKQLEYLGGARLAGIVMGAKVPIILTSRADSAESREASCAIASILLHHRAMEQGRQTSAGVP